MTPYELELAVHDYLCYNVSYVWHDGDDPLARWKIRTVYNAIINGDATCVGFALTFQYIMNMLGIECLFINVYNEIADGPLSELSYSNHVWNTIKLDDEWYHVDVSTDAYLLELNNYDPNVYAPYHYMRNFNRTDEWAIDHRYVIDHELLFPAGCNPNITCTATKYSYEEMDMAA